MTAAPGWRAVLAGLGIKVHPAADRFRLLEGQALQDLAADIERHGLRHPPVLWRAKDGDPWHLADGRNRCSAMALLVEGDVQIEGAICLADRREGGDLNALIRSLNVERRHLSAKEKDDRIAELLVADPTRSDRQIATETGYHKNKVGRVRSGLEDVGAQLPTSPGAPIASVVSSPPRSRRLARNQHPQHRGPRHLRHRRRRGSGRALRRLCSAIR
jgi:ParB-like chromosome segregation protein Spo0J